ncbi:hypothetical protein FOIG_06451 [Fusarium odoratissimum NRRL 54006]|nr:uncharacterized protein FOIG_06451 [Fusarium odoratissimum NRRL 54006]EXM02161.1 hypothetical protein FOIG_06451 [Fusarium odoratissimum NRRL 54006]
MARSSKRQESYKTPDRPSGEAMGGRSADVDSATQREQLPFSEATVIQDGFTAR